MEGEPQFESREDILDRMVAELEASERVMEGSIFEDIRNFAPIDGNPFANPEYLAEIAEKLRIPVEEMNEYACKIAVDPMPPENQES